MLHKCTCIVFYVYLTIVPRLLVGWEKKRAWYIPIVCMCLIYNRKSTASHEVLFLHRVAQFSLLPFGNFLHCIHGMQSYAITFCVHKFLINSGVQCCSLTRSLTCALQQLARFESQGRTGSLYICHSFLLCLCYGGVCTYRRIDLTVGCTKPVTLA